MNLPDGVDVKRYRTLWNGQPELLAATAAQDGLSTVQIIHLLRDIADLTTTQAKMLAVDVLPTARAFHGQLMADLDELEREEASGEPAP